MTDALSGMTTLLSKSLDFYNPMTNWQRFFNPQFIVNNNSGDADIEASVLGKVGSYGKQIGILIAAVDALQTQIDGKTLTPEQHAAVEKFDGLRDGATNAVAEYRLATSRSEATPDDVIAVAGRIVASKNAHDIDRLKAGLTDILKT